MPLNPLEVVGGIAIGTGVGGAIETVVDPQLQNLRNSQWGKHADKPLELASLARLIAESVPLGGFDVGQDASYLGISDPRFKLEIELARQYPALPVALALWRRGYANYTNVSGWLHRAGLSDEIVKQLIGNGPDPARLFYERLDPAVIATAIQRSIFPAPTWLPTPNYPARYGPSAGAGKVEAFTQTLIDAKDEAEASGVSWERVRVETALVGLPLSLEQAASAYFRNIIELPDFARAVEEGNTRIEWGPAALEQARQILTANQYAELQLRGFLTAGQRRNLTARHGMSDTDSDHLFDVLGRSINPHQIVTGEARGGTYKPPPDTLAQQEAGIPPAFLASLQRGNLRPEYYDLAYANRYTYPSFFAIRGLLTGGVFTADEGYQILLEMGWKPELARKVADFYGAATGAVKPDPWVAKAETQLWGTTHRSFIASESDEADATPRFTAMNINPDAQTYILELWREERALIRKQLTPAQIKKAYEKLSKNYATGVAWTRDDALAALVSRGYSVTEANDYLDIPSGK